ncbi:MAG: DNA polymerase I [Armatimonadetes bacterium]|nr:DNA polymerase I [Armatimonadota bacterium]
MPANSDTRRVVLMDGHSLAYRAFYALPPLHTKSGEPVNGVLGFTNMLLKTVEVEAPDFLILSFDRGLPTLRLESFAEYKAGRDKMPEGLGAQLPVIEEVVRAFGIPIFTAPGQEADDCIGTLARRAEALGYEVVIVSGDLDMLQLVGPRVRVMATIRGVAETVRYDEKAVWDRYGFSPDKIPDYKALAGDSSDNIPGVAGIGKGTASKLIQEFGSLEGLLERLDDVPPRWREKIAAVVEDVKKYKSLATINTEVDLDVDWSECAWQSVPRGATELLRRLEFFGIIGRLKLEDDDTPPPPPAEVLPLVLHVVEDEAGLDAAMPVLAAAPALGFSWVRENGATVALGIAVDDHTAYAMPVEAPREGELFASSGISAEALAERVLKIAGANGRTGWSFDWKAAMVEWSLDRLPRDRALADVAVASYLLESGESQKSLAAVALRHGRRRPPEAETLLGKGVKALSWIALGKDELLNFAGETAASTLDVGIFLGERIVQENLQPLFALETDLAPVLARMERAGVAVDVPYLRALAVEMERELDAKQREIWGLASREFNINSPKQLGEVLFDDMKIPGGKKTKTGAYTTDAEMLTKLAVEHPVCQSIMEFREISKLKGTYVEAFPRLINPRSGRLHSSWNATVAATGRLSSSDPNMQNIPIRSELGRRIRRAFVAEGADMLLLCADYSQIELRIMAHLSEDPALVRVFTEGGDVHQATAAEIFHVDRAQVTTDMRRKAKEVNFGIMYGMGPEGLSTRIHVSRREAKAFIEQYLSTFAGVRRFTEQIVREAVDKGYVSTMLGRRRYLPDVRSQNRMIRAAAERMAINAPIQGSAADLIKLAMVRLDRMITAGDLAARMIMQVHDELVFEVPRDRSDEVAAKVQQVMESAIQMRVPIQVDVKVGLDWNEVKHLEKRVGTADATYV